MQDFEQNEDTMGSQKVPATYDNVQLTIFRVGIFRAHAHTCSIDSALLEAPAEGLFWNLPEFNRRIQIRVLHVCKACHLETHFQSR
jgi:hypothetical protein